ncbi:RNA-directed DNA polymerase [Halobacillus litoralis]|uniref:RNA-directed DNA polymerase n=1 Tax=Halobacillus litoralis TaxID=45668 RepID=UPI001370BD74|nr:RNA-directed DNA polymerase [Halobacillus litoralis]
MENKIIAPLLTDTLPSEIPIIFSIKTFHDYIINHIEEWNNIDFRGNEKNSNRKMNLLKFSIPFSFLVNKNNSEFRKIDLVHPLGLLQMAKFLEQFNGLIVNYFDQNNVFSIRVPLGLNNTYKKIPKKYIEELNWVLTPEKEDNNSDRDKFLRNYFNLGAFPRITDFYKSYYLKHLEQKYTYLTKLDFSNCFDRIYTHSIDWAYYGSKSIAKDNISNSLSRFSGILDKLTQSINYNETNGIVVGPEFSRTVADVVLCRIDNLIYDESLKEGYVHKRDYEIIRYIDDYFIFTKNFTTAEKLEGIVNKVSIKYKMNVNKSKKVVERKPFLRSHLWVTKVKDALEKLLNFLKKKDLGFYKYGYNNFYDDIRLIIHEYEEHSVYIISYIISTLENKIIYIINDLLKLNDNDLIYYHFSRILDLLMYIIGFSVKYENVLKVNRITILLQKKTSVIEKNMDDLIYKKYFNFLKYNSDKFIDLTNVIILLTFNNNNLPREFLIEILKRNESYFSLSVITYYIINKKDGCIYYKSVVDEINVIVEKYIEQAIKRFSVNINKSDKGKYDGIDGFLLSDYFYILHDLYSSGILNNKNLGEINKIKSKISTKKDAKGMELYNLFLGYIANFDKPFMDWEANFDEIFKQSLIRKHKSKFSY